jgi:hypothetical protein
VKTRFSFLLAAIALAGCSSSQLRDYRYAGVGDFKDVSLTIPGEVIPGFELTLPGFDLSSAQMTEPDSCS